MNKEYKEYMEKNREINLNFIKECIKLAEKAEDQELIDIGLAILDSIEKNPIEYVYMLDDIKKKWNK